ncbi:M23 family metallopeptidase [uncultured Kordia sp.]|uniref:M23 family metallopeptidase n=1 Tax=uncultured Kordia sp. TaxID=507699 RepID=UPI00263125B1|nr:M23 family metallopeptidase [uncultured Kordia sp.]
MKHIYTLTIISIILFSSCTDALLGDQGKQDEDIYLNYQTKTDLELPFEGEWYVSVGGRTHAQGQHHFITRGTGQRYAYDMGKIVDDSYYSGNGGENEDTYTFGARLNAPGAGKIIALENNIDDNTRPGVLNDNIDNSNLGGNYIMIDHLNGEYSFLAHLKKGSIIVVVGDMVAKGQEIGQAGNSGNSSGPHLHYHLQNSPNYLDAIGLPAQFTNYLKNDDPIDRGEPVQGQLVRKN